jgi:HEAT repeat protein
VITGLPGFRHLAVPLLLEALGDEDERENALWHISSLGPLAKGAVPALLEEGEEKEAVAFALERIGWDFGGKPAREDPGITLQDEAPKNASGMGSPELPADPKRIRKLKEDLRNPDLRLAAVDSLGRMGPEGLPPLLDLLRLPDIDQEFGRRIKSYLDFRYSDVRALPILVETLEHPDPDVREWAASCLGELGPRAAPAVDALVRCLSDRETREHAMAALGRIGPGAAGAVEALEEVLLDAEDTDAAWALSKMEGKGLPALLRAASHSSPTVRAAALHTFGSMGRDARPALDALIRALEDREPTDYVAFSSRGIALFFDSLPQLPVGAAAAWALEKLGPLAMEAVPALVEALGSESVWISIAASRALGVMGPGAAPDLERALADPREDVRGLAAFALGRIGPGAGAAIPALRRCLTDESDYVRICAAEALGRMGPDAGEALPALRKLAKEGSKALRVHAQLAARKIEGR